MAFLSAKNDQYIRIPFMQRRGIEQKEIPVFEIPENTMSPDAAYRIVKDELNLDGNPLLNLASFVTTRMDPECDQLMMENLNKNFIDSAEYPQCSVIEARCVAMLRSLYHAPMKSLAEERTFLNPSLPCQKLYGVSTVGSSEAIHLGALNMKWIWEREQPSKYGESKPPSMSDVDDQCGKIKKGRKGVIPNIIFSEVSHVCWNKFCRYFSVEPKIIPISLETRGLDIDKAIKACNENTIGIVTILGNTYTGEFDDVEELNRRLDELNKETGWNIPIHVDAASGGMIAPFLFPDLKWDFKLKWVKSINVSGHKYGMVYPGIGWILFRDWKYVHKGLIFEVDYLGSPELTLTLNFSKGASHILGQFYNFLRLGKIGYKTIMEECMMNAKFIEGILRKWDNKDGKKFFNIFSTVCERKPSLPVVAFEFIESVAKFPIKLLLTKMKERGWIIPMCLLPLPSGCKETNILRIVVRETLSEKLTDMLIWDIHTSLVFIQKDFGIEVRERTVEEMNRKRNRRIPSIC